MNLQQMREEYEKASGRYVPTEDMVDTIGRFTITVPVAILEGINIGGMFGQNLSAEDIAAKFQSAMSATIQHARETKAPKTATLPFRLNTYGLQFAELTVTPTSPGNFILGAT